MSSDTARSRMMAVMTIAVGILCGCGKTVPTVATPRTPAMQMFDEYSEEGVVVIALGELGTQSLAKPKLPDLVSMQLGIVNVAVRAGPVLLMVPHFVSQDALRQHCKNWPDMCSALHNGRLRIVEVEHEGVWIRDYGPQFGRGQDGTPIVFDAGYRDHRSIHRLRSERGKIDKKRRSLIEELQVIQEIIAFREGLAGDSDDVRSRTEKLRQTEAQIKDQLNLLREKADVYSDGAFSERVSDDESPIALAQQALQASRFRVQKTPLFVEGGNLMRLPGGRCATTSEIIAGNNGKEADLERTLVDDYGCRQVIYLAALPGRDVIKHVDMFLLPIDRENVALAQFDPTREPLEKHFVNADEEIQELVMKAAIAMDRNEVALKRSGLRVHRIPTPLPRKARRGIYFPTVMNALVRMDGKGVRHVVLPSYVEYEEDVQKAAVERLRQAFPKETTFGSVEATAAAEAQGAVHCLSLVIPADVSIFGDQQGSDKMGVFREILTSFREPATQIQKRVEGHWRIVGKGSGACRLEGHGDGSCSLGSSPIFFNYSIRGGGKQLLMRTDEDDEILYDIEWTDTNRLRMKATGEDTIVLERVKD